MNDYKSRIIFCWICRHAKLNGFIIKASKQLDSVASVFGIVLSLEHESGVFRLDVKFISGTITIS